MLGRGLSSVRLCAYPRLLQTWWQWRFQTPPALRIAGLGKVITKSSGKDLHPRAILCIVIGRRKEQHRKANTMKNTTTAAATTLASAGMNKEGAAMHAARYLALRCLADQAVWVRSYLGLGVLLASPLFRRGCSNLAIRRAHPVS